MQSICNEDIIEFALRVFETYENPIIVYTQLQIRTVSLSPERSRVSGTSQVLVTWSHRHLGRAAIKNLYACIPSQIMGVLSKHDVLTR